MTGSDTIAREGTCLHCGFFARSTMTKKDDKGRYYFGAFITCPICGTFDICMEVT